MSAIVACAAWVPQGEAKQNPEKIELTKEELQKLISQTESSLEEAQAGVDAEDPDEDDEGEWEDVDSGDDAEMDDNDDDDAKQPASASSEGKAQNDSAADGDDNLAIYNFDDYDDEGEGIKMTGAGLAGLTYYASNTDDPYVTLKDEEDDDIEDLTVGPNDNLIAVGRTEDAFSHVEIHLWNEETGDFYVHHDILLSAFPLCMEWLNFDPNEDGDHHGNLLAIGTMDPIIEVWDLDVVDAPEPAYVLGRKRNKKKKIKAYGHTKEVLGLSWNAKQRNFLASCSADKTVKLWDLEKLSCLRTYTHHNAKVEHVKWNIDQPAVLLTAAHDHTAAVFDSRTPEAVARWEFDADVECVSWNPHAPHEFVVGLDDGHVLCCDARNPGKTSYRLAAHSESVSTLAMSAKMPNALMTGSTDGTVKLWNVANAAPALVVSQDLKRGPLYTIQFSPNASLTAAMGGHTGGIYVRDMLELAAVRRVFGQRDPKGATRGEERAKLLSEDAPEHQPDDDMGDSEEEDDWEDIMSSLNIASGQGSSAAAPGAAGRSARAAPTAKKGPKKGTKPFKRA